MVKLKFMRALAPLLLIGSLSTQAYAQEPTSSMSMTLDECLEYAKQNSITLQKVRLQIDDSQADLLSAKGSFLPSVSGSVSQSLSSNPLRNESGVSNSSYSGSYGVDLSMTLYNGGRIRSQLEQSELSTDIANLELSEYENSLEVAVTEVYIEILYAIEQIGAEENSLELSIKSEERGMAFFDAGSINSVDLAQLESATAASRYDLVVAKSQLSNLYVELKHLLEISQEMTLSVVVPELLDDSLVTLLPSVSDVYESALVMRPEVASSQLYIESAELEAKIAKAGYLPTLSLSAGTGVNHNSSNSYTFSTQLRNNFTTSAGLNLSIPIFSNYKNRSAVIKAQNSVESASLSLSDTQKSLYQTIESLHNNAANAQAKYLVSEYQLRATEKSLDLTTQQYELGMKNIVELLSEQDNYRQAYQEFLTNKYQLVYNRALLNYYKTNLIEL